MIPKCRNCGKLAMYGVGSQGQEVPLCLDCGLKYTQILAIENDQLERSMNYATDQMEAIVGMPGILPRFRERQVSIIQGANVVLNNIHVSNSNIGVLNTLHLEIIDSAITQLNQESGAQDVSASISKLANGVLASNDISNEKRNEAMEILSVIAAEATAPKEKRRPAAIKSLLGSLSTIIQTSASLLQIWQTVEPALTAFFQ